MASDVLGVGPKMAGKGGRLDLATTDMTTDRSGITPKSYQKLEKCSQLATDHANLCPNQSCIKVVSQQHDAWDQ